MKSKNIYNKLYIYINIVSNVLKNSNAMITIMTVVEHLFMTQFWHICKSIESNFETFETCSNLELTHLNHRLKLPKRSSSSSWFGWPRWNLPRKMDHPEVTLASLIRITSGVRGLRGWNCHRPKGVPWRTEPRKFQQKGTKLTKFFLGEAKGFCHLDGGFPSP